MERPLIVLGEDQIYNRLLNRIKVVQDSKILSYRIRGEDELKSL